MQETKNKIAIINILHMFKKIEESILKKDIEDTEEI